VNVSNDEPVMVLDHGMVRYIDHMGSDERVIEMARQSTKGGFRSWEPYKVCDGCGHWFADHTNYCDCNPCHYTDYPNGDMALLRTLYRSKPAHTGPFEHCVVTVQIQAPIFVFREHHRHRTQSYSELSARYAPLPDQNYVPTVERCLMGKAETKNRQAQALRGAAELTPETAEIWLKQLRWTYEVCEQTYQMGLAYGIPKELARLVLPVGRYSRMAATANLLNWIKFLRLRCDNAAQWEIRVFADQVREILCGLYPRTMRLFADEMDG
jgi:thymidylate synthase (FAD)